MTFKGKKLLLYALLAFGALEVSVLPFPGGMKFFLIADVIMMGILFRNVVAFKHSQPLYFQYISPVEKESESYEVIYYLSFLLGVVLAMAFAATIACNYLDLCR